MRTTLTLDDDVVALLEEQQHRRRLSFKEIVNDAIRRGLSHKPTKVAPYRVRPHQTTLLPGVDPAGFNRLADEMEEEAIIEKLSRL